MGLSRRQFTKEFKLAAIQRLEMGASLAEVNRAGYYRFVPRPTRPDPDLELRDALQRVALEFPSYGWPRMTAELQRRGWAVNHKRVYRLMREDNLLCLRKRKFVVTTDSDHGLPVYPNLVPPLKLTGSQVIWILPVPAESLNSDCRFY